MDGSTRVASPCNHPQQFVEVGREGRAGSGVQQLLSDATS